MPVSKFLPWGQKSPSGSAGSAKAPVLENGVLPPESPAGFVSTPQISRITARALRYLNSGYPIHFRGPSGTGKTSLALHVAAQLGRPVVLLLGDEQVGSTNLIGSATGFKQQKSVDEFVRNVTKTENIITRFWVDSRLTTAVKSGYTLVYDEYTRSRPESNTPLLSILEERMLPLPPDAGTAPNYIPVDPAFSAIFTSNPEEYAGVHRSADALQDRMITLDIEGFDAESETAIAVSKGGLDHASATALVSLIRAVQSRSTPGTIPTLRSSIMLSRIVKASNLSIDPSDVDFVDAVIDVLVSEACRRNPAAGRREAVRVAVRQSLREQFPGTSAGAPSSAKETSTQAPEIVAAPIPIPLPLPRKPSVPAAAAPVIAPPVAAPAPAKPGPKETKFTVSEMSRLLRPGKR